MTFQLSLKYRIALVIFILEAVMITAVLLNTTQESLDASNQHQKNNHDVIITLLGELSTTALLTEEFTDVQLYFEQIQSQADIEKIILSDSNKLIVVSSQVEDIGDKLPELRDSNLLFWRNKSIESEAGNLGVISLQFTNKELLATNNAIQIRGITIAATGMLIIMTISLLVGFALTRRLDRISQAAKQFADGDTQAQSNVDGFDELGKLGRTFDNMVKDVGQKQYELELHQNHLEDLVQQRTHTIQHQTQIINQIHDSVIVTDRDGYIKSWNNGAQRLFGYTAKEAIKKHIRFIYPKDNTIVQYQRISYLKEHGNYESEEIMFRKNGEKFWGHLSLSLQRDENQHIIGMIGYTLDISSKKTAEEELTKRSKQLEITNQELESFSYSVSHDLRSPLRAMNGFCSALIEDYSSNFDKESLDLLVRIKNNSIRMGRLIDDLLNLSRIGRKEISKSNADLSAIAERVISRLRIDDPQRQVAVKIQPNLHAYCDKNLFEIVMDNLLNNAWKYTSKREKATIEFGEMKLDGSRVFYVKDNGAGFDIQFADKLFGAFQRLHKDEEFEGTGVGLTTVYRIIHRHYGRIWADAEIDKGATFYFNLPMERKPKT